MQQVPGDECVKKFFFKSLSGEKALPGVHVTMGTLATCSYIFAISKYLMENTVGHVMRTNLIDKKNLVNISLKNKFKSSVQLLLPKQARSWRRCRMLCEYRSCCLRRSETPARG